MGGGIIARPHRAKLSDEMLPAVVYLKGNAHINWTGVTKMCYKLMKRQMCVSQPTTNCLTLQRQQYFCVIMRPSSLGGAAYCVALCLSVCPSVCPSVHLSVRPSRYCLFYSRTVLRANIQNRKNFCFRLWASVTSVLFGTHRGPHIVRPSRPHKFLFFF